MRKNILTHLKHLLLYSRHKLYREISRIENGNGSFYSFAILFQVFFPANFIGFLKQKNKRGDQRNNHDFKLNIQTETSGKSVLQKKELSYFPLIFLYYNLM